MLVLDEYDILPKAMRVILEELVKDIATCFIELDYANVNVFLFKDILQLTWHFATAICHMQQ